MRDAGSRNDPREPDPRAAQRIDPKTGTSDDPRVDPRRGPGGAPDTGSPKDGAWENDLTEEDIPDPAEREPAAHDLRLDA